MNIKETDIIFDKDREITLSYELYETLDGLRGHGETILDVIARLAAEFAGGGESND